MKKAIFLLSLVAFVACETELDTIETPINDSVQTTENTNNLITAEEAAAQALEFRQSLMAESGITRSAGKDKGVASVYAWRTSKVLSKAPTRSSLANILPDTLLYIVNFEQNSGYALVSATKEVPGVVAYIDNGGLTPDQPIDNPGFNEFLENYGENYASIRDSLIGGRFRDSLIVNRHIPDSAFQSCKDSLIMAHSLYKMVYYVEPMLKTKWGQGAPYNKLCFTDDGRQAMAGCVPLAAAQIAAYHKMPKYCASTGHTYNWEAILSDSIVHVTDTIASNSVAELIHDIGVLTKHMIYGVSYSHVGMGYLENTWNDFNYMYTSTTVSNIKFNYIKSSLGNNMPVVYGRDWHTWAIDGIAIKRSPIITDRSSISNVPVIKWNYRNYVHCNWGWDGVNNGFFLYDAFDKRYNIQTDEVEGTGYSCLDINAHLFYNIYPNDSLQ